MGRSFSTWLLLLSLATLQGCSYTKSLMSQVGYSLKQVVAPEQSDYKHMLNKDSFFVFGRILHSNKVNPNAIAVIALSDELRVSEVVEVDHLSADNLHFALNLPEGDYRLLVVTDLDRDGHYVASEVIGGRRVSLNRADVKNMVLGGYDIDLAVRSDAARGTFDVAVQGPSEKREAEIRTGGMVRTFNDPIFAPKISNIGMYDPAAFLEAAPQLLYTMDADDAEKIPVIFVHGINGSARDFQAIVEKMDRARYRPYFFYYPSGSDLKQLGALFYKVALSGQSIALNKAPVVIVAHSMGGLVVREALNQRAGNWNEARVARLVTLASPFGGMSAAKQVGRAPVVVPSWRNLNPDGEFIARLHRKRLPIGLQYDLLFAYGDTRVVKLGENSDGVVALESQLAPEAQDEATKLYGFNDTHDTILTNPQAIEEILRIIGEVHRKKRGAPTQGD